MTHPFFAALPQPLQMSRRVPALTACAGFALLAACASLPSATSTNMALPVDAPAAVEDYDWHFERQPQTVQLAYGVANSDDIPLGFSCRPGSNQILMTTPTLDAKIKTITLGTSEASQTYPAQSEAAEMFDGYLLQARTTTNDPVLVSFAKLGWLVMEHEGRWAGLSPQSATKAVTKTSGQDFLAACR